MSNKTLTLYEFDGFSLDTKQRCLLYADEMVSLTPKAFQTLLVLVRHRGETVEKETLLNEVWADTFVEETTLAQNILTLRKTLAAFQKEKEFIVTVPRRGYRFIAEVREIINDDEIIIVEKHTRTHITAAQKSIHDSDETAIIPHRQSIEKKFSKTKIIGLSLVGILILAGGFFALRYYRQTQNFTATKFQQFQVNTLLSSANIRHAILSPNSKYLALIEQKGAEQMLVLRQIENGNIIEVVPKFNGNFIGASFSPDSEQIYFSVYETTEKNQPLIGSLYKIPFLGGAAQKISHDIDTQPAISPDNRRLAFMRRNPEANETALIIADIDGKNERILAVRNLNEGFTNGGFAWSPDGKLLSSTVNQSGETGKSVQIAVINTETGEQKIISRQEWLWAGKTAWLKDGSGIAVVAYGTKSPNLNDEIWLISFPEGKARPLTNGINGIFGISLSDDSNSLVAVKSNKITNFLTASLKNLEQSNPILTKTGDDSLLPLGADWTSDGKILYSTTTSGNADIWTINLDGNGQKQITSDPSAEFLPRVSNDGRFLIFLSNRSGQINVWRTNADGTNPTQLSDNENVSDVIISPDGGAIFFIAKAAETNAQVLWKISINGEFKTQTTKRMTFSPRISPDGKTIACYFPNPETKKMMLTLLSADNGEIIKHIDAPKSDGIPVLDWSKDGENLFLIFKQNNAFGLWKLHLQTTKAEKLHEWENDSIFRFVVSKDGTNIFYEKGIETNSVVLLKDLSVE
ncbi:MAG TPA: winged helix-turn-helix domain-containing protein [Pyrinomonadaceae bacterium]|nr:winged helix-turn-helix domain-containing protein [Pyrinomonadaceae bacterium]